jgi:predicted amidohydrolase
MKGGIKFMTTCQIAVCQVKVAENKEKNLQTAREMVKEAAGKGAELVVLPEMFNCPYEGRQFPWFAEEYPDGSTIKMLAESAQENQVFLVGGSIPEKAGDKIYNTSFIFDRQGQVIGFHRKVHLFDVNLPGGLRFYESETLGAGESITVVDSPWGKIGVAICYDIRFPELARRMVDLGARIIIVPAAFNLITGPAHWHSLLKIRAVDNQVFVIGASPARDETASYVAYGHSLIIDPWGDILGEAGVGEDMIFAKIDLTKVDTVRAQLPLLRHRRHDLYEWK